MDWKFSRLQFSRTNRRPKSTVSFEKLWAPTPTIIRPRLVRKVHMQVRRTKTCLLSVTATGTLVGPRARGFQCDTYLTLAPRPGLRGIRLLLLLDHNEVNTAIVEITRRLNAELRPGTSPRHCAGWLALRDWIELNLPEKALMDFEIIDEEYGLTDLSSARTETFTVKLLENDSKCQSQKKLPANR